MKDRGLASPAIMLFLSPLIGWSAAKHLEDILWSFLYIFYFMHWGLKVVFVSHGFIKLLLVIWYSWMANDKGKGVRNDKCCIEGKGKRWETEKRTDEITRIRNMWAVWPLSLEISFKAIQIMVIIHYAVLLIVYLFIRHDILWK